MQKVLLYSVLLLMGVAFSQMAPALLGEGVPALSTAIRVLTMTCLSYIMITVGREFVIDKSNLRSYGVDYGVAFLAATLPWIFVVLYFVVVVLPPGSFWSRDAWIQSLLAGRFASPTSAGVLFTMLAAAGLAGTWVYRKVRILAIFDDLDTVLLMIPLKMLMVGFAPQLLFLVVIMMGSLLLAWRYLHALRWSTSSLALVGYSVLLVALSEGVYWSSGVFFPQAPVHIEVLLPAFVLGCMLPAEGPNESHRFHGWVSAAFLFLVGASMPALGNALQGQMSWTELVLGVLIVTLISNIGKMYSFFCYREEASWRERLAVSVAMFPRGEVGAGVIVVSLSYGIDSRLVALAMLSLLLNLLMTGLFILVVKRLLLHSATPPAQSNPERLSPSSS